MKASYAKRTPRNEHRETNDEKRHVECRSSEKSENGVSFKADLLEGIHLCLGFHLGVDDGGRV